MIVVSHTTDRSDLRRAGRGGRTAGATNAIDDCGRVRGCLDHVWRMADRCERTVLVSITISAQPLGAVKGLVDGHLGLEEGVCKRLRGARPSVPLGVEQRS